MRQSLKLSAKAIYVNGRAMGSLPVDNEGRTRITGGVIYYDRINLKLIPSGGIIWRPNEQNELRLVFPDPRWSHYLTKANETDWWFFVRGEVGGGRYYISSKDKQTGLIRQFNTDYDDYRLSVGTMFDCASGMKGSFEIGGAFSRRLVVKAVDGGKWYTPKDSVFFKVGLHF
ncbi:MAG: hypothetical protein HUK22_02025 [Thermoguttaceae bacterium]|nr:hypothetical protein [Thermoguttaceae bacterium]